MESLVTLLITCFSVLSVQLTSRITEAQQCQASVDGISLSGHVMSTVVVDDIGSCSDKCAVTPGCQSINFYMKSSLCELNNKTVENTPSHKVQNNRAVYFKNPDPLPPEPVRRGILLGSGSRGE
ncbi:uncharacterized protein LOC114575414 [Exaiptasia diaphana]|uniref:Apple domain-containing protein n=1 Tax=Exaiptasia diaphana TaxID=2652724 RepID=A0A913YPA3_EXADI|nr:uncharacterized protein LOC114575414 [Exaiptasia diaphana]